MVNSSVSEQGRLRASAAGWLAATFLAVIATCLLVELGAGSSHAGPPAPAVSSGGSDSIFAVAGQITPGSYGIYLVDTKNRTICVYQWLSSVRKLRLMAGRNYTYDLQLDEYNTTLSPREIKAMVERSRRLGAAETRPSGP